MAWSYASATRDFFDEFGREIIQEMVNQSAPLLRKDPKYKRAGDEGGGAVLKKKKISDMTGTVQPSMGGYASAGVQADGGNYPTADAPTTPDKGYYSAAIWTLRPLFPISAMRIGRGGKGWNVLKVGLEKAARQAARIEERMYIGAKLGTVAANITGGAGATFTIADFGGIRAGDSIEFFNGTTFVERGQVQSVTVPASGNSTVTMTSTIAQSLTAGFNVYLRVAGVVTNAPKSLANCTDSSDGMYDGLDNTSFPAGELDSSTTAWSNTVAGALIDRASFKAGQRPTHIVASPFTRRYIFNAQNSQTRFIEGDVDVYGNRLTFDGIPIVETPNQGKTVVDFIQANEMLIHEAYDWGMDTDGNGHEGFGGGGLQLSEDGYNYIAPISKAANLRVENRQGFARQSAIAS